MKNTNGNRRSTTRRRILKLLAVAGGAVAAAPHRLVHGTAPEVFSWRGTALGARASLTLFNVGPTEGNRLVARIADEVARLEKVFSLYRADSTVSILNANGRVANPPIDMVRLLAEAAAISRVTDGAFDVTVQPLWTLYANHFNGGGKHAGPGPGAVQEALHRVGYRDVSINSRGISLGKPGMSITLNGIAQGYITDRIADLLRARGFRHVLIDLGEIRALDAHPDGRPWSIGLQDPADAGGVTGVVEVRDQAVATSAGSGTRFDRKGLYHHLFDPRSGGPSNVYDSVSVIGERATVADALSTGLYHLQPDYARAILTGLPGYSAHVVYPDGRKQTWL